MELILGAGVSLLIQFLKNQLKTGEYTTLGILLVISLLAAAVYTYLVSAGLWETFGNVLIVAGAFYAFIVQRFMPGSAISKMMSE